MPSLRASMPAVLVLLALLAPTATAQKFTDVQLGDVFKGAVTAGGDQDGLRFDAVVLTALSVTIKGKDGLLPVATLVETGSKQVLDTIPFEKGFGGKAFKIVKFVLPVTGTYELIIEGLNGTSGSYTAKLKGKVDKSLKKISLAATMSPGTALVTDFEGAPSALATITARPGKASGAVPTVDPLDLPVGGPLDLTPFATIKGTKTTIKKAPLTDFGIHTLTVVNDAVLGLTGEIKVLIKLKFAKHKKVTFIEPPPVPGSIAGVVGVQQIPVLLENEPNDDIADTEIMGSMSVGSLTRILATLSSGNDFDGFNIVFEGAQSVEFLLLHDILSDFDILFFEGGTANFLGALDSELEPELGILDLPAGGSIDILIAAFAGSGDYLLTMQSGPYSGADDATAAGAGGLPEPFQAAPRLRGEHSVRPAPAALMAARRAVVEHAFAEGQVMLNFRAGTSSAAESFAAARGLDVHMDSPSGLVVLRDPAIRASTESTALKRGRTVNLLRQVNRAAEVERAELDYVMQASGIPNDQLYNLQWHYPQLNLPAAWDITTGSANVIVSIIDTGITGHPDLVNRDTGTGYDMISEASISLDGNGVDPDPTDVGDKNNQDGSSSWHGTHVAGTVGAQTNNTEGGAGVDWACGLMHVRVLGKGGGLSSDINEGIRYSAGLPNNSGTTPPNAADVINMSLGGGGFSQIVQDTCNAAVAAGTTIVAAAGNENTGQLSYPASYANVISISATDFNKNKAPYSNFGTGIDVAAPGGNVSADLTGDGYADGVLSTLVSESGGGLTPSYVFYQGTSMASPHVAGVCSLLLAVDPALTPAQIENLLKTTAEDLGAPGRDDIYGDGLVDALGAVQAAQGGGNPNPVLSVSTNSLNFGTTSTTLPISIANAGGGDLNVNFVVVEFSGAGWLSAQAIGSTINVTVDRNAVAAGSYTGQVQLTSNGGNANVAVSMSKTTGGGGAQGFLDVGTVFVLAVDLVTNITVGQATASQGIPGYQMDGVPPGAWLMAAGPDLDNDNFICGLGEPCGLYPVLSDPVLVGLLDGGFLAGIDIPVFDDLALPAVAGSGGWVLPAQGFEVAPTGP